MTARIVPRIHWTAALLLAGAVTAGAQPLPMEMRVVSESVPPGGVLQAKVEITEPRPISTGGGSYDLGAFDEFLGLAVNSPSGDAAAAAVIRGSTVRVRMVSPSADLGLAPDYPILTMTVRVPAGVPVGTRVPLTMAGGALFLDPAGVPYPFTFRPGEATVRPGPSVSNVTPGSGLVPAGGLVVIEGTGFAPNAEVRISETAVAQTRVVGSTRIEVVLAQATTMHGHEVQVRNPGTNDRTSYFAYQRTSPLGVSGHALFRVVEPAFPQRFHTSAALRFNPANASATLGLAVQNIGGPAQVQLELFTAGGARLGPVSATLGASTRAVRTLSELFGATCTAACVVRVTSSAPIQVMGLAGDTAADAVVPVLPVPDVPMQLRASLNAASFRAGDLLVVRAEFTPGLVAAAADVYLVLQTPTGQLLSLTASGLTPGLAPFMRNVVSGTPVSVDVLRTAVPAGAAPGTYQWLAAMTAPGTLTPMAPVVATPFAVMP